MNHMPEVEVIPASRHYGLAVVPYSPLARGVLTAKYDPDAPPPGDTRAGRGDKRMLEAEWRPESLKIARAISAHAALVGTTAAHLAIRWVLNNAFVTATIVGPRTVAHMRDYISAMTYGFTAADEEFISSAVAAGHPSTPGYNDPHYAIEGRVPVVGPRHGELGRRCSRTRGESQADGAARGERSRVRHGGGEGAAISYEAGGD